MNNDFAKINKFFKSLFDRTDILNSSNDTKEKEQFIEFQKKLASKLRPSQEGQARAFYRFQLKIQQKKEEKQKNIWSSLLPVWKPIAVFSLMSMLLFLFTLKQSSLNITHLFLSSNVLVNHQPILLSQNHVKLPAVIETKDSALTFNLDMDKTFYLYPHSKIFIKTKTTLFLKEGAIAGKLYHIYKKTKLQIQTKTASIKVIGTKFLITQTRRKTEVSVQEGHIQIIKNNTSYDVHNYTTANITSNNIQINKTTQNPTILAFYNLSFYPPKRERDSQILFSKQLPAKITTVKKRKITHHQVITIVNAFDSYVPLDWSFHSHNTFRINKNGFAIMTYQVTNYSGESGFFFNHDHLIEKIHKIKFHHGNMIAFTLENLPDDYLNISLYIKEKNNNDWINSHPIIKKKNHEIILYFKNTKSLWNKMSNTTPEEDWQYFNKLLSFALIIQTHKMEKQQTLILKNIKVIQ